MGAHRGISDAGLIEVLYQVARRGGGLGDVDNALWHASLLAGGGIPGTAFVMAALEDLNLLPQEGRK